MKPRKIFLLLFIMAAAWLFAQELDTDPQAELLYQEALRLYNLEASTDQTDSLSLLYFQQAAQLYANNKANAARLIDCYEKSGTIYQTTGNQDDAIGQYRLAIGCFTKHRLPDSLIFNSYLYGGSAFYFKGVFDSAKVYLEKAEQVLTHFPRLAEANRLFNSFGALYFEAGNYRQSINYFQKALETRPDSPESIYTYKNNIASALRNLGEYDSAIVVYKSIRTLKPNPYEVNINLGATYVEKNWPDAALPYLWKAGEQRGYYGIVLQNALGKAHLQQKKWLEADFHFRQALQIHQRDFGQGSRNVNVATTYKLRGDLNAQKEELDSALVNYQRAITVLTGVNFAQKSPWQNPTDFSKTYNSFQLFEVVCVKALRLAQTYQKTQRPDDLHAAIDTYNTVFKLASYVQKTFDNDEARLYLARKGFPVYQQAVKWMMRVYERTRTPEDLERAFGWAEQSKATVLQVNLKEAEIKANSDIPDSLLQQERNLRYRRSGLLMRLSNATDSTQATAFAQQLLDSEVALSRLTDRLHDFPAYYEKKFSSDSVDVAALQSKILDKKTALLSYFEAGDTIFCFLLTATHLSHFSLKKDELFSKAVRNLTGHLRQVEAGRPYGGSVYAQYLYERLIKPVQSNFETIESLVVLPHGELSLLPFEVLENVQKEYLLKRFQLTYQYSVVFLKSPKKANINFPDMLAVAPFDKTTTTSNYAPLVASEQEIASLSGMKLRGIQATKSYFLKFVASSSAIHLATHAVADNQDPLQSYVVFYPADSNHRLYAHELANGILPQTQLVFLSACETASGKVEKGEGVMSLARTFALAGCNHLVTSLWKAEDHATAYISERFYAHLRQGLGFDAALRQAKLDLLKNNRYAQFHSPQYWSHLVYIGTPLYQTDWLVWGWILGGLCGVGLIGIAVRKFLML